MTALNLKSVAAYYGGKISGNTVNIPTPGHSRNDQGTSISLAPSAPDGCLVHCFNGTSADALAVKDMLRRDGFLSELECKAPSRFIPDIEQLLANAALNSKGSGGYIAASVWDYVDAKGNVLYRKNRVDQPRGGKTFFYEHVDTDGNWKTGLGKNCHVLYRLPDIIKSDELIFAAEGERCADKLVSWGLTSTSTKDMVKADLSSLKGRCVIVLPDNDDAGLKCARSAVQAIQEAGGSAITITLPNLPENGDIIDWKGSLEELLALIDDPLRAALSDVAATECNETSGALFQDNCDPIDLWDTFGPPDLPVGLLPSLIETWARETGATMGADPAGLAMSAVAACAAAIPDRIELKVKRYSDWSEAPRIWVALVGPPSAKKSPVISAATAALCSIDSELMRKWQSQMAKWLKLDKEEKTQVPQPRQIRLRLTDTTVEAAQQVLLDSTDGVLLLQDELTGFFGSMDRYGSGSKGGGDRAFWLQAWNGGEYAVNRVGRGASLIPNLSVSLLGGIQPEPFRKVAADMSDDGLIQRLFPIMLQKSKVGKDEPLSDANMRYGSLIRDLKVLRQPGKLTSDLLTFSEGAQKVRAQLEEKHHGLQSLELVNKKLASHIGKYDGLFARLCVVWHCIDYCSGSSGSGNPFHLPSEISQETAQNVANFMHSFLLPHAFAFYAGCLGLSSDHDRLENLAGYILAHKLDQVTNRDVQRGNRTMRKLSDFEVKPIFEQLEALGWLQRKDGPRPSSKPHFLVNPLVHSKFERKAIEETERRQQAREMILKMTRP